MVSLSVADDLDADETAVVITDGGMAIIRQESGWTLTRKAEYYQAMVRPRHDRVGYVCSCNLGSFGDLSTWRAQDDENSGLWTSMYVAAQAFRFAVTKACALLSCPQRGSVTATIPILILLHRIHDLYSSGSAGKEGWLEKL